MPTSPMSHSEVKAVEDQLEVSPSCKQPTSNLYQGGGTEPEAIPHKGKHAAGAKGHVTNSESGFGRKGSSLRRNIAAGKASDTSKDV